MIIYKEEHFGTIERLRELIKERDYSVDRLARESGVSNRTIRRWLSGETTTYRSSNLKSIAEVLECDLTYLRCEQNTPRKCGRKIKLSDLSIVDRYLPKIQDLAKTTTQRFTYTIETSDTSEHIFGTFVEGETRYYYEDITSDNNDTTMIYYQVSVNGSDPIKKSEAEMNDFVKGIMKYISFEIEQLKE